MDKAVRLKPTLPEDLLYRVFTVRCLAVCKAWQQCLDPRALPVELCEVLQELSFSGSASVLGNLVRIVPCCVGQLRHLELAITKGNASFDARALGSLSALEQLELSRWHTVKFERGRALMPRLTKLKIGQAGGSVELDAVFPNLQRMTLVDSGDVWMNGDRLHLPRLSVLVLNHVPGTAQIDFARIPALEHLAVIAVGDLAETGISSLSRLVALSIGYNSGASLTVINRILSAAATSLRKLLEYSYFPPAKPSLGALTQLTTIQSVRLSIILQLAPLTQLQNLQFRGLAATDLAAEHLDVLAQLPALCRLNFTKSVPEGVARKGRLAVLKAILPGGCIIEQP
ncbi:hypothetical protein N2152v2_002335 [Parachlorella kessleri]